MKNTVFHHKEFEIGGMLIPEFELKRGSLIRVYIPNFNQQNLPLGFDLCVRLIKRFQCQKPDFIWAKNYHPNGLMKIIRPLTVKRYLLNKMRIDMAKASPIADEIGINLNDQFEQLSFAKRKALIIKATFEKHDNILLDYYGVDAEGIAFLEKIINDEIEKGRSAIGFDRLEYAVQYEKYENIKPIRITAPNDIQQK